MNKGTHQDRDQRDASPCGVREFVVGSDHPSPMIRPRPQDIRRMSAGGGTKVEAALAQVTDWQTEVTNDAYPESCVMIGPRRKKNRSQKKLVVNSGFGETQFRRCFLTGIWSNLLRRC